MKAFAKRVIAALLCLMLLPFSAAMSDAQAAAIPFRDVASDAWYAQYVQYAYDNSLMEGTSADAFSPGDSLSRAMVITVLYRLDGQPTVSGTSFADVPADMWYTDAVSWGAENGIVNGYDSETFGPNDAITREQTAVIFYRYAAHKGYSVKASVGLSSFPDGVSVSDWAQDGMKWSVAKKLFLGDSSGDLLPRGTSTRAMFAAVLTRFCTNVVDGGVPDLAAPSSCGALRVEGTQLVDSSGSPVQLKGISTHGIAWYPQYINESCFAELRESWNVNVIRLSMYTAEYGGYCTGGDQAQLLQLIDAGVTYATAQDMYVIIDWHILSDGDPNTYLSQAKAFFDTVSAKYADHNNVLYEICNEPNGGTSWQQVKRYAEQIIPIIRSHDSDGIILVGTPNWCQYVDQAAADPITGYDNIMYTLHFYAATHTDSLRSTMVSAVQAGLPIFVSEYGICDASGAGAIDEAQANKWISLLNQYGISYVAWNLSNKSETCAILDSSCTKTSGFQQSDLSASGVWLYNMLTGSNTLTAPDTAADDTASDTATDTGGSGATGSITFSAAVTNSWQSGGQTYTQYELTLTNTGAACSSWRIEVPFNSDVTLVNGWNGTYSASGNRLTISSADYNGSIAAGGTVSGIGFIVCGGDGIGSA